MPIAFTFHSARQGLPRPDYDDTPIDLVDLFQQRDAVADFFANIDSGPLSSRPVSTTGSPGKARRFYMTTDQPDSPRLDLDYGTGWVTIGPAPSTNTFASVLSTVGSHSIPGSTSNYPVPFDTVVRDSGNNWDEGDLRYTVPSDGVYQVNSTLSITGGGATTLKLNKNASSVFQAFVNGVDANVLVASLFCVKNDLLQIVVDNAASSAIPISGSVGATRATFVKIANA